MASASSYSYGVSIRYDRVIDNGKIPSSQRNMVPVIKDREIGYLKESRRKAWRRGFWKYCASVERNGLEIYAPTVNATYNPFLLNTTGKKTGPPEPGAVAAVEMLKLLPSSYRSFLAENYVWKIRLGSVR